MSGITICHVLCLFILRVSQHPADPCEALSGAASEGLVNAVELVLKHFPTLDVNALRSSKQQRPSDIYRKVKIYQCPALHRASLRGHTKVVDVLLAMEAVDVNAVDSDRNTALHIASYKGHLGVVDALLAAKGIDRNAVGSYGKTALNVACEHGHVEVVDALLVAEGIDRNAVGIGRNAERIGRNVEGIGRNAEGIGRNVEGIGRNVEGIGRNAEGIGRNVNGIGRNSEGIGRNAVGNDGSAALRWACQLDQLAVVGALLAAPDVYDVDVNGGCTNGGWTALHYAANYNRGPATVINALLAAKGINVNAVSDHGETALHRAARCGRGSAVRALLAAKDIDIDVLDHRGLNALHYAYNHKGRLGYDRKHEKAERKVVINALLAHKGVTGRAARLLARGKNSLYFAMRGS